jgi:DNA-binding transcriptional regulator YdaS (Cro superfamily)
MLTPSEALETAIRIGGGPSVVASELGVSRQALWKWQEAPAHRVADLERLSRGKVSRHELRPDLFGSPAGVGADSAV